MPGKLLGGAPPVGEYKRQGIQDIRGDSAGLRLPDGAELPAPQLIQVDGDGFQLTCEIAGVGTLGCAVNYLTVKSERLAGSTTDQLKSQAEHLASKLTYLLEPVVPI